MEPQPKMDLYRGVAIGVCDKSCPAFLFINGGKSVQKCLLKTGSGVYNSNMFSRVCEIWAANELKRLREKCGEPIDKLFEN